MKSYVFTILFFSFSSFIFSQNCQPIRDQREFFAIKNRVMMNRNQAFTIVSELAQQYCLTTSQARELAGLLSSERDKMDFLVLVYPNLTDYQNVYGLFDAFRNLSTAFQFYHLTIGAAHQPNLPIQPSLPPLGQFNCQRPVAHQLVDQFLIQQASIRDDRTLARNILNYTLSNCIYAQSATNLASRIQDETIRLDVMQRMIPNVFDIENYRNAAQLLRTPALQQQFIQSLQNTVPPASIPGVPNFPNCQMNSQDFKNFLTSTNKISFDSDKVSHIKTFMNNRCLTSNQIKELVLVSTFESTRLEIAKYLYDYCIDKQNFYVINDNLKHSSSREELNTFIQSKQ